MRTWSSDDVERVLREAATTLLRLPSAHLERQHRLKAWWPDVVADRWTDSRSRERPPMPRIPATAQDISRCDAVLELCWTWLTPERVSAITVPRGEGVPEDMHRIVWMRALGRPWSEVCERRRALYGPCPPGGATKTALIPKWKATIAFLAAAWSAAGVDPDQPDAYAVGQARRVAR